MTACRRALPNRTFRPLAQIASRHSDSPLLHRHFAAFARGLEGGFDAGDDTQAVFG